MAIQHYYIAKNINKTKELLIYKIYQKARRKRLIVVRVKSTGLAFVEFFVVSTGFALVLSKSEHTRKNLKKIQQYQKHRKRQQNLNISDLENTF